jgi:hypothetical protein
MKKTFNDLPIWGKAVVVALLAVLAYILYLKLSTYLSKLKADKLQGTKEGTATTYTQVGSNGQAYTQTVNPATSANSIYSAIYQNDWFGFSEDEEKIVTEVMNVPNAGVGAVSDVYFKIYGKNLKEDLNHYLSTDEWNKIASKFI